MQRVGIDLSKLERLEEAFVDYDRALAIRRRFADAHPERSDLRDDVEQAAGNMGDLAFTLLLTQKFKKSLDASERAIAAAPRLVWLVINRAHALMFLHHTDEARALYRAHLGEKTNGDKIWEDDIRDDFVKFRNRRIALFGAK